MRGADCTGAQLAAAAAALEAWLRQPAPRVLMVATLPFIVLLASYAGSRFAEGCHDSATLERPVAVAPPVVRRATPAQIAQALAFLEAWLQAPAPPILQLAAPDALQLLAWYGALRFEAGRNGLGTLEQPGVLGRVVCEVLAPAGGLVH